MLQRAREAHQPEHAAGDGDDAGEHVLKILLCELVSEDGPARYPKRHLLRRRAPEHLLPNLRIPAHLLT